jgi:hypothetical protein
MILKFPDLDTLKLVLISGAVPPSVSLAPATAGFDDQGQLWLEPSVAPARKAQDDLKKYGVAIGKKSGTELSAEISCWLEMLPLLREREIVAPPEQTPVLFDLASGEQLTRLATEMLRLGNDRQGYRWLQEKDGVTRALLRVVGPPYYSLLRAIDGVGPNPPIAFVERATRVWVQLGYAHPLADRIKPPQGQMLLLRPPRMWTYLPEEPYRDIYDVVEFQLPGSAIGYKDTELKERLSVSLRLAHGGATELAELWVLRNNPVAELNKLVQNSKDELLNRLAFAVGESKGKTIIVLRVRPSKEPAPVLVLDAVSYRPYWKLPNLFVPCGRCLQPPLRRDIVRDQLADDPNILTWLHPESGKGGAFTPETISQDVFRPLRDWVDYVVDQEREALTTWIQSNSFDFESFLCEDEEPSKPKKPPVEKGRGSGGKGSGGQHVEIVGPKDAGKDERDIKALVVDDPISLVPKEPTAQQKRRDELEEQFKGLEGPLDLAERQAMWPELASLNMALKNHDDAGTCWLNVLWYADDWPEAWLWAWFHNEATAVKDSNERGRKVARWTATVLGSPSKPRELPGEDLDRVLSLKPKESGIQPDVRALAAYVVWASRRSPPPVELVKRLNAVGRFLEAAEENLAIRARWLAWLAFSRLTDGDVLALARARDRLLERLFQNGGLQPSVDLPTFLRVAGQPATQRFRGIREWMLELCNQARDWSRDANQGTQQTEGAAPTLAYIQCYFAYGLARMGEKQASNDLFDHAKKALEKLDDAHKFLLGAFGHRIRQAQTGQKNAGPLPAEQMEYLQKNVERIQRYVVDRLRQHSRILEPEEKIDPYADWAARTDDLATKLAETARLTDKKEIAERLLKLMREVPKGNKGHEPRARILRTGLDVAPRVSEEFALEILGAFGPAWDALPDPSEVKGLIERAELLERGLFVSAHFDRKDHVQGLISRFQKLLQAQRGSTQAMQAIERLASESLRGLRKLGMRDEIDLLLKQMADVILEGKDPSSLTTQSGDTKHVPAAMRALLHVASGWLYFGRERQAEPIINVARTLLLHGDWQVSQARERASLAGVYARTVGAAGVEIVKSRLTELFRELKNIRDMMTTSKHYSLLQLDVVESVVLAIAGEDQTLGANARRWLDDDEFIVRRRVHRDFQAARG